MIGFGKCKVVKAFLKLQKSYAAKIEIKAVLGSPICVLTV